MLPSIARADSVEMLRDGGSLCAAFVGADSCQYWLLVPIERSPVGSATFEDRCYADPVVIDRPFAATPIQVSWEHAAILLRQIVAMLPADAPKYWVAPMSECLARCGNISYGEVKGLRDASPS